MTIMVVGAGVTGLTVAERLSAAGRDVIVLEKEQVVGGLCRSFHYGDFTFDIGPHRLFSPRAAIHDYFLSILGDAYSQLPRESLVHLNDRLLTWPLGMGCVFSLPPATALRCLRDLVCTDHRSDRAIVTLEDFVVARYGPTIYEMFWKGYTRKFLGLSCDQVDADWGSLSVGRSVVDGRTQPLSLGALVKSCLAPRKSTLSFLYPDGGMDAFPNLLRKRIESRGGRVLVSQRIDAVRVSGQTVTEIVANGVPHAVDALVWTGLLPDLCALLGVAAPDVQYLSTLLFNLELRSTLPGKWQWVYFPDPALVLSRISMPSRFSAGTAPPGRTGLCAEVSCMTDSEPWRHPDALTERVIRELAGVGLIAGRDAVAACRIERVTDTYPIYRVGYQAEVKRTHGALAGLSNLHLTGRQASFVHDNIDEAVEGALDLAGRL